MLFCINKQVDLVKDLPADIQSAYLRNTMCVQFDQSWVPQKERTEPSLEDLTDWCSRNCEQIFGVTKWTQINAKFQFYARTDLERFERHLKSLMEPEQV